MDIESDIKTSNQNKKARLSLNLNVINGEDEDEPWMTCMQSPDQLHNQKIAKNKLKMPGRKTVDVNSLKLDMSKLVRSDEPDLNICYQPYISENDSS